MTQGLWLLLGTGGRTGLCFCWEWQGLEGVVTVLCLPSATLTCGELSPSWRAPCRGPAVAVPPAPAPLAPSPVPKEGLSLDRKQGPVNGPEFEVSFPLPFPDDTAWGGELWAWTQLRSGFL